MAGVILMSNFTSIGYHFEESLPYPMIIGLGEQSITNHSYYWDNNNRPDNHCLIQYTLRGQGELIYQGASYIQKPGDIFLINIPSRSKYFLPADSNLWDFIYIEFSIESILLFSQIINFSGPTLTIGENIKIIEQIKEAYHMALNNKISTIYNNSKVAYNLLMDLLETSKSIGSEIPNHIELAKKYIDSNYSLPTINLDGVAEEIGVSKFHLAREFHKKFGITVNNYLTTIRIEQACRLLKQKNFYSIKKIAELTGFSNDSYFGKVFKKVKGQTPLEYKKQNNNYDIVRIIFNNPHKNNLEK